METYTCTVVVIVEASTKLALNLNAFFFLLFLVAKKAAASAMVKGYLTSSSPLIRPATGMHG